MGDLPDRQHSLFLLRSHYDLPWDKRHFLLDFYFTFLLSNRFFSSFSLIYGLRVSGSEEEIMKVGPVKLVGDL